MVGLKFGYGGGNRKGYRRLDTLVVSIDGYGKQSKFESDYGRIEINNEAPTMGKALEFESDYGRIEIEVPGSGPGTITSLNRTMVGLKSEQVDANGYYDSNV